MSDISSLLDDLQKKLIGQSDVGYYNWTRQIVSFSAGALTLTISLQKLYIPDNPSSLWLLQASWICWLLSLFLGFLVLYGETQIPLDNFAKIQRMRQTQGDVETGRSLLERPLFETRKLYYVSFYIMASCFISALLSISLFAIFNVMKIRT